MFRKFIFHLFLISVILLEEAGTYAKKAMEIIIFFFYQTLLFYFLLGWQSEMKIRRIPYSDGLNLIEMLTDTATITEWNLQVSYG